MRLFLFAAFAASVLAQGRQRCPPNQVFQSCGSACPETCEGRPRMCTMQCVVGCGCARGFVKDKRSGRCIRRSQCPRDGGSVSISNPCAENPCNRGERCLVSRKQCITTPCPQYECIQESSGNSCAGNPCSAGQRCVPSPKRCITFPCPQYECIRECPRNEVFQSCGTACPVTCDETPTVCTEQCVSDCFCAPGFVRDKSSGRCVHRAQCPRGRCPRNEVFKSCGTACPETCEGRPLMCTKQCVVGCACAPGFVKDERSSRCVRRSECPRGGVERPERPGTCPEVGGSFGICVESCTGDDSCPVGQKCCSNGCGHSCATIVQTQPGSKCPEKCSANQECVFHPILCKKAPCPQYRCQDKAGLCPEKCPANQECVFTPVFCITQPCPQYQCKDKPSQCTPKCAANQDCVHNPLLRCIRAPCNQYQCRTRQNDVSSSPCEPKCGRNEQCLHNPKQCFAPPCPQHDCIKGCRRRRSSRDPCRSARCPAYPDAKCFVDASCRGFIFVKDYENVTPRCFGRG